MGWLQVGFAMVVPPPPFPFVMSGFYSLNYYGSTIMAQQCSVKMVVTILRLVVVLSDFRPNSIWMGNFQIKWYKIYLKYFLELKLTDTFP